MSSARGRRALILDRGSVVAGYRVDGVIGHGGMGVVYEATQLSLKRTVALKLLATHLSDDPRFRERFRREGEIQARLDHPNIVSVHEAGESEHGLFLAMRLVRGPRLKDLILDRALNAERTVRILSPVADALDAAHEEGLIHRDVKPQNVLVGGRDHAFLADFGLTKLPGEKSLTETGQFLGTLDYVAPEQIVGERASTRTDVYSFAAVLCECLTGSVPYLRDNEAAVLYAHLSAEPPRLTEREPQLPEALDDIVARGLSKEPGDRPASPGALMEEVEDVLGGRPLRRIRQPPPVVSGAQRETSDRLQLERRAGPTSALSPEPDTARLVDRGRGGLSRRRAAAVVVLFALAGLCAGAAAGLLTRDDDKRPPRVDSPAVAFARPAGWSETARPAQPPGYRMTSTAGAVSGSRTIAAGQQRLREPTLIPVAFRTRIRDIPLGPGELVRVAGLEAQAHRDVVTLRSRERVTIFAVPTSAGIVTLACIAPPRTRVGPECDRAAATLEIRRGEPLALKPNERYGRSVDSVIGQLQPRRRSQRLKLAKARTRFDQEQATGALAAEFNAAARSVDRLRPPAVAIRANDQIAAAMRRAAAAYGGMRKSALAFDQEGWERGKERVRAAEARVQGSLDALRRLGYTIV